MTGVAVDRRHLRRALQLARKGRYGASPNPMVGSVIVRDDEVVGEGYHRRVGGPHAEIEALAVAGPRARGADLYVTMEPCDHTGRTPPCSQAVIEAGVRRVVACHRDPNPRTAGGGFARLRAAGIDVVEAGGFLEEAVRLNWRFLVSMVHQRPAVTLKWAMSLDGRIATRTGDSQWISSPGGRRWGLDQRERHDAILVGIGTALADDPRLDRRLDRTPGPIVRVVMDRGLRMPSASRMLDRPGPVVLYTEADDGPARRALEARGATVVRVTEVTPRAVLEDLGARGVSSVLVEGGSGIAGAFVAAGLFDRVAVDCAGLIIGGREAPGPVGGDGAAMLTAAARLDALTANRRDGDIIVSGFREGCLPGLYANVAAS